jgi:four helix bundle protein
MNYRSSKLKAQSSRKASRANSQVLIEGWEDAWWREIEQEELGALVLREEEPSSQNQHPWNLEERVTLFGEQIVRFSKKFPRDPTNNRLIDQLVGAGTSVGANYCEANEAVSKRDFRFSISRCVKEAKETKFFLRMAVASEPPMAEQARPLYREAHELLLIFGSMRHK